MAEINCLSLLLCESVGAEDAETKKGKTIFVFLSLTNMIIFFLLTLLKCINLISSVSEAVQVNCTWRPWACMYMMFGIKRLLKQMLSLKTISRSCVQSCLVFLLSCVDMLG